MKLVVLTLNCNPNVDLGQREEEMDILDILNYHLYALLFFLFGR